VSGIVSFIAVKWLLRYVQTHTFIVFGWYRIGLAALIGVLLLVAPKGKHELSSFQPAREMLHHSVRNL
jgi:hypothetical protein